MSSLDKRTPGEITEFVAAVSKPMDDVLNELNEVEQSDLLKVAQEHNIDSDDPLWHLVGAYVTGRKFNEETLALVKAAREAAIAATQEKVDAMALSAGEAVIGQIKEVFANEIKESLAASASLATQETKKIVSDFEKVVNQTKKEIGKSRKTENIKTFTKFLLLPVFVSIIAVGISFYFLPANALMTIEGQTYQVLTGDGLYEGENATYIKVKKLSF